MLSANETIAKEFHLAKIPFVYRIHENPDPDKIEQVLALIHKQGYHTKKSGQEITPKEVQKALGEIDRSIDLISSTVIEPVQKLKVGHMGSINPRLHTDEVLICLAVSAATNPTAKFAMEQLSKLKGAQLHSSVVLSHVDSKTFKKLGIDVTCEPKRQTEKLYNAN